jgi:pyruvate formate lyase activating enzyme
MKFGGLQKNTLIDYPGKIGCVLFFSGCNFSCPYCHNPELARGRVPDAQKIFEDRAIDFLSRRRGLLEGVVISGGEACLSKDLKRICRSIKAMGYAVKLDTNGSRPKVLKALMDEGLVDFVAMDVKAAPAAYFPALRPTDRPQDLEESIDLLLTAGIDTEFRTTCAAPIVDAAVIEAIARRIAGAQRYVLQPCLPGHALDPTFFETHPNQPTREDLHLFQAIASPFVKTCTVR